jgi:shikimate kinase
MMGSGKSTVGPLLAVRVGLPFVDIDTEIEKATARSVSLIWAEDGEPAFRAREREMIARMAGVEAVVATGGGAPVDPVNRKRMRDDGRVVWLDAGVDEITSRIGEGFDRPVIAGEPDVGEAVRTLLAERRPFYEEVADLTVVSGGQDVDTIVEHIAAWFRDEGLRRD